MELHLKTSKLIVWSLQVNLLSGFFLQSQLTLSLKKNSTLLISSNKILKPTV